MYIESKTLINEIKLGVSGQRKIYVKKVMQGCVIFNLIKILNHISFQSVHDNILINVELVFINNAKLLNPWKMLYVNVERILPKPPKIKREWIIEKRCQRIK